MLLWFVKLCSYLLDFSVTVLKMSVNFIPTLGT